MIERLKQNLLHRWKFYLRLLFFGGVFFALILIVSGTALFLYAKVQGPPPLAVPQTTVFYGADGEKIGESHNGQNRYWVELEDISPAAVAATLAIEDRKFFDHHGFDLKRIIGAAIADIKAMAKVQGASTITQQYARNLFLEHDKTWSRKLQEALYTIRLEFNYTKEEILEGYLNTIYYGHGIYGIEAAANYYFNKPASDLTVGEASLLSGIPKGPAHYSPIINEERAKSRQEVVLEAMVKTGELSEQEAVQAFKERLEFKPAQELKGKTVAPYFLDAVKEALRVEIGLDPSTIEMGGLKIYTTLDPKLQALAEETMNDIIDSESKIQAALVAMDPKTGEVKAMIGGRDYEESPFNRAVKAERMPGSTFKPFLYYAAIENGFTPATTLRSEPTIFTYDNGYSHYKPDNFNSYYANDDITLAQAIALSDNIYAVKTNMFLNPAKLVKTAKDFGITSKLKAVPSLALGTSTVKVIDMVNGYSRLANGGKAIKPVFIKKIVDYRGEILYEAKRAVDQALNPQSAFVTAHLMTGMFDEKLNDYTTVTGQSIKEKLTRTYAGKSGTTATDSWMIGFAPQLTAGVWVGYDRDEKITIVKEKSYAKEIWSEFMESALSGKPKKAFKPPEGVVKVAIDPHNGLLATEACPVSRTAYFIEGTEPVHYCTEHLGDQKKEKEPTKQKKQEKDSWFKRMFDFFN